MNFIKRLIASLLIVPFVTAMTPFALAGNKDALYELHHEQSHNKYREAHADFPDQFVEQGLIDEVYAHLDGFITTYGAEKLLEKRSLRWGEKDWFENVVNLLVNDYVPRDSEQRDKLVKKLAHVFSIIKLCFQHGNGDKIMAYIKQSKGFDEILGITPLEHKQWLVDAGIQPINHEAIREKWAQFKADSSMKALTAKSDDLGGIDFNPERIDLQVENNGGVINFNFDPAMIQQLQNMPGFVPVVIDMHPLNSVQMFLGLQDGSDRMAAVR